MLNPACMYVARLLMSSNPRSVTLTYMQAHKLKQATQKCMLLGSRQGTLWHIQGVANMAYAVVFCYERSGPMTCYCMTHLARSSSSWSSNCSSEAIPDDQTKYTLSGTPTALLGSACLPRAYCAMWRSMPSMGVICSHRCTVSSAHLNLRILFCVAQHAQHGCDLYLKQLQSALPIAN